MLRGADRAGAVSAAGLSYEQAPPFAAPLRLFQLAPVFLLLAACLGLVQPDWQSSRWTPASLALTHLITLGYLAAVMLGALLQLQPVVLGAPVPAVRLVARLGLLGLAGGAPCLAFGFLLGEPLGFHAGMALLSLGLAPFLAAVAISLIRTAAPQIAWPIRQAALSLAVTLTLGIALAGGLAGLWPLAATAERTALHAAWGLVGWVLILVIGVAYQVVPMLQITPAYPARLSRWLTWSMLCGLLLLSSPPLPVLEQAGNLLGTLLIAAAGIAFAAATLRIQAQRRRKIPDITLNFWRLGMACLLLTAACLPLLRWLPAAWAGKWTAAAEISLGIAFLLGFAASVVSGMLYKIVPFLAWFHLKTQTGARVGSLPNMKEMIPEARTRLHFRLHLSMLVALLPAPFLPAPAAIPGLLLLAASAILQGLNLRHAKCLFLRFGGRLD